METDAFKNAIRYAKKEKTLIPVLIPTPSSLEAENLVYEKAAFLTGGLFAWISTVLSRFVFVDNRFFFVAWISLFKQGVQVLHEFGFVFDFKPFG